MSRSAAILGDRGWHESGVDDDDFRPVQPDALLDVAAAADRDVRVFVEYDRTRRVDKNYDKFLRYETLIAVWWQATDLGCPFVVFVCQDADHRRRLMHAADVELIGHLSARTEAGHEEHYYARDRTLFVLEVPTLGLPVVAPLFQVVPLIRTSGGSCARRAGLGSRCGGRIDTVRVTSGRVPATSSHACSSSGAGVCCPTSEALAFRRGCRISRPARRVGSRPTRTARSKGLKGTPEANQSPGNGAPPRGRDLCDSLPED